MTNDEDTDPDTDPGRVVYAAEATAPELENAITAGTMRTSVWTLPDELDIMPEVPLRGAQINRVAILPLEPDDAGG